MRHTILPAAIFLFLLQYSLFCAEMLKLSPFSEWTVENGSRAQVVENKLFVSGNFALSKEEFSAKPTDCFGINCIYEKTEQKKNPPVRLELGIAEYDDSGKFLGNSTSIYTNPDRPVDHFQTIQEVRNPHTAKVKILFGAAKDSGLMLNTIEVRKLEKNEQQIYSPTLNRREWLKKTQSEENLAYGKKCIYSPQPDMTCSKNDTHDAYDLTDGEFANPRDEAVSFCKGAVGWATNKQNIKIMLDLEVIQPVNKALIRVYGGRIFNGASYLPPKLEAWVSKDGENYFLASRLTKLQITEKDDADGKTLYWLPEIESKSFPPQYMHTFELDLNADARYVLIAAPKNVYFVTDEIAVLKAKSKNATWNKAYESAPQPVMHHSLVIQPETDKFYVAENFYTPQWFRFDDRREKKEGVFSMIIDIPDGIDFAPDKNSYPNGLRTFSHEEKKGSRKLLHFKPAYSEQDFYRIVKIYPNMFGPFYFKGGKEISKSERYAVITTYAAGKELFSYRSPVEILTIPKVASLKNIQFIIEGLCDMQEWPNIFEFLHHVNSPYFTVRENYPDTYGNSFEMVREAGAKTYLALHPTTLMKAKSINEKNWHDLMCNEDKSEDAISKHQMICPSYRGKYYQNMLDKTAVLVHKSNPDIVVIDEEAFMHGLLGRPMNCSRCNTLREKMKMDWKTFYNWVQADYLGGISDTIRKNVKKKDVKIISYAVSFQRMINTPVGYVYFNGTNYLFPRYIDMLAPSAYTTNTKSIHDQTSADFKVINDPKKLARYITMGTGPYLNENYGESGLHQILESVMNGCSILFIFSWRSFSALDYAYIARAYNILAPFDDFLMKAGLDEKFTGSNKKLCYTTRTLGKETLLLIGNYGNRNPGITELDIRNAKQITDLMSGKELYVKNGKLTLEVGANDIRFLHIIRQ